MDAKDTINILTGNMSLKQRDNARRWLASLPEDECIQVLDNSKIIFYQIKQKHPNTPARILNYCSLILAIRSFGWDTSKGKGYRIAGNTQFNDWAKYREIRIKNLKEERHARLKSMVMAHWGEIKELKAGGVGFRRISKYLQRYRKISISSSYLHIIWNTIEK